MPGGIMPISCSTHFTGMGFDAAQLFDAELDALLSP